MIDRRLHVLRMLRQHGTVTATAEALHLTPSAVSQQLRALARDLDVSLLRREGRGVRLTRAAESLLAHADVLYAEWEATEADLDAHRHGTTGPLRVCGFPSVLSTLLPDTVAHLRRADPGIRVEVTQSDPAASLDLLLAGDADLALLEASSALPATTDHRFAQHLLFEDPLRLVVPRDHALAGRRRVALADATDEDWVAGPVGHSFHQIELAACRDAGFVPRIVHRALDWTAYLAVVRAGLGVALMPGLSLVHVGDVPALGLTDRPPPRRRILTCIRRGSEGRPAIARLHAALRASAFA